MRVLHRDSQPGSRWWLSVRSMVLVMVVASVLGPTVAATAIRSTGDSGAAAQVGHPAINEDVALRSTAREALLRLADSITGVSADLARGYAYHHQRRWILDTTGTPAPAGVRENAPAVFAIDLQRWEASDGSGRGIDVRLGPDYTLAGASPTHRTDDTEFARGTVTRTDYRAGNLRSLITGPLAADPQELARQLAFDPSPDGPQATLRSVDEIYTSFYVGLAVRKAALRVLADIGGLTYQNRVTDRLGRTGVAVSFTGGGVRYTLIFDRDTGLLLASQQQSLGAHDYLDVPHGLVRYYTLFIEQSRRDRLG
jgi:hypothetical protein